MKKVFVINLIILKLAFSRKLQPSFGGMTKLMIFASVMSLIGQSS